MDQEDKKAYIKDNIITDQSVLVEDDNSEENDEDVMLDQQGDVLEENVIEVLSESNSEERSGGHHSTDLIPVSSRGIVSYNTLTAYLREISRIPPMSREEEFDLAVRYRKNGDMDAARRLVVANLWLVVRIAREYERAARSILDIIQEGNIGLMEAVRNFDPDREVRFPSYAVWWIKAYIIRSVSYTHLTLPTKA